MEASRFIYHKLNIIHRPLILLTTLINGEESEQISIMDRGFQYGDGLFETIRFSQGIPQYWQEHINRLVAGCDRLNIPTPDRENLKKEALRLCKGIGDGVLKIIISRGPGERGYALPVRTNPTRVLITYQEPDFSEDCWSKGIVARVCDTRLGFNFSLAGLKHLNRLEQIMARSEWNDPGIHEGLMLDMDQNVIEGTMSNLYCVKDNELLTPDLSRCGVKGIIREQIIKMASQMNIKVHETNIPLDTLYDSDEVFVSNSLIGIWPVRQLERHEYKIGPVSNQLIEILNNKKHGIENVA